MPPGDEAPFELGTDGPTSILVGVDGSTTSTHPVVVSLVVNDHGPGLFVPKPTTGTGCQGVARLT
jgi:hypothetical protein